MTRWILGDHARLVDTTSETVLTEAIVQALRTRTSGAGAAAWAHARYSWEVVAGKYVDFFTDVLDTQGRRLTPGSEGTQS